MAGSVLTQKLQSEADDSGSAGMWIKAAEVLGYWLPVLAVGLAGGSMVADAVPQYPGGGLLTAFGFLLGTVWAASKLKTTFDNKFKSLQDSVDEIKADMVTKTELKLALSEYRDKLDGRYMLKSEEGSGHGKSYRTHGTHEG